MKTFSINPDRGTIIHGRELPIGCIYGQYQGVTYYCESLFSPKKGYLYIRRWMPSISRWTVEEPVRNALTEYILSTCAKHGITTLTITPPAPSFRQAANLMSHTRGRKRQGRCLKTVQKLHWTRGDSNDWDREGNWGYGIYKDTRTVMFK